MNLNITYALRNRPIEWKTKVVYFENVSCNDFVEKKRPCPSLLPRMDGFLVVTGLVTDFHGSKTIDVGLYTDTRIIDFAPQPKPFSSCIKKELTDLLVPGMNIIYKKLTSGHDDLP